MFNIFGDLIRLSRAMTAVSAHFLKKIRAFGNFDLGRMDDDMDW